MKILVTSDWHLDAVTAGVRRFSDLQAAVQETIDAAARECVDLYLFLGDACDPDAPYVHECVGFLVEVASTLFYEHGIPSYWLTGNHDVVEDGSGASTLSALKGWERGCYKATGGPEYFDGPSVRVFDRPGFQAWTGDVAIIALPFVARSHAYSPDDVVRDEVRLVGCHFADGTYRLPERVIVAGHLNLEGITPGSESHELARGRDVFFPIDTVREVFGDRAVMLNGHYHERQVYRGVRIPGSLERLTFGERGTPGYLIVEIECSPLEMH